MTELKRGAVLDNRGLQSEFGVGVSGGIRKSTKKNLLVLVSDHTKGLYDDKWFGDTLHYTGQGLSGDQSLDYRFNRDLYQSNLTGIALHLFEVFEEGKYVYHGRVELASQPYQAEQLDADKQPRLAWLFPLRLLGGAPLVVPASLVEANERRHGRQAKKLRAPELKLRAEKAGGPAEQRTTTSVTYVRDPYVVEYVKRLANGVCESCFEAAPFSDKEGEPFLEVHHVQWLSQGGKDAVENAVALCPNCHRRMHVRNDPVDIAKLKARIATRPEAPANV